MVRPITRWCGWWWIRAALEPQRGGTRQDDVNRLCWLGLAPVAQLAEQRTFNPWVLGSSPSGGTKIFDASESRFCAEQFLIAREWCSYCVQ